MQKAENWPLARSITYFFSKVSVNCEKGEQVGFDGGSILHFLCH